jgi:hypothetical protein
VVDFDTALGQQLLDIAVGRAVAAVPLDRDRDHLRLKPEPGEPIDGRTGGSRSTHPPSLLNRTPTATRT